MTLVELSEQLLGTDWPIFYEYEEEERIVQSCINFLEALLKSREDGWSLRWSHVDAEPKEIEYQPLQSKVNGSTGTREEAEALVDLHASNSMVQNADKHGLDCRKRSNAGESTISNFYAVLCSMKT